MSNRDIKLRIWGNKKRRECFYCGVKLTIDEATVDHFRSKALGGSNRLHNTVISCAKCNNEKADKPYGEFLRERIKNTTSS